MEFKDIIVSRIEKLAIEPFNDNSIFSDEYEIEASYVNKEPDKTAIEVVYTKKSEPWDKKVERRIYITIEEGG